MLWYVCVYVGMLCMYLCMYDTLGYDMSLYLNVLMYVRTLCAYVCMLCMYVCIYVRV